MKTRFQMAWRGAAILFTLLGAGQGAIAAVEPATPDVADVIQKAVARAQQDEASGAVPDFQYTRFTLTEELDTAGKVVERKEKVYDVACRGGLSQVNLLEVDGHPPTANDKKKQTGNEMNLRQLLGQAKTGKGDARENFLTPELAARFQYKLIGRGDVNGRAAYQVSFEPKDPDAPVRCLADRLLNRLSGTLWIDADEFEVARAEVVLRSEVNLFGGIAGTLKKLAYTLVRTRVADGLWLSTLSSGDFEGRKLLDQTHVKMRSESVNIRPVAANGEAPRPAS